MAITNYDVPQAVQLYNEIKAGSRGASVPLLDDLIASIDSALAAQGHNSGFGWNIAGFRVSDLEGAKDDLRQMRIAASSAGARGIPR